jgi:hypothetical protein
MTTPGTLMLIDTWAVEQRGAASKAQAAKAVESRINTSSKKQTTSCEASRHR